MSSGDPERPDLDRITDRLRVYGPAAVSQIEIRDLITYALALEAQRDAAREALEQFARRDYWIERSDGRLTWIPLDPPPDELARAALAALGEAGHG